MSQPNTAGEAVMSQLIKMAKMEDGRRKLEMGHRQTVYRPKVIHVVNLFKCNTITRMGSNMCVCVCVRVCVHVRVCAHAGCTCVRRACVCVCALQVCVSVHIHKPVCVCVCVCVRERTCVCVLLAFR